MATNKKKLPAKRRSAQPRSGLMASTTLEGITNQARRHDMPALDNRTATEIYSSLGLIQRFHKWFFEGMEASQKWRTRHIENMRFLSNDQWSDEDRAKLEKQGRPALVINKMTNIIISVSGLQRRSRQDIDVVPVEPEDALGAEYIEALVKHVRDRNRMRAVSSDVFLKKIASGKGFWKLSYDFTERPQGEIVCEDIDPLTIIHDPNWPRAEWERAEWVMHAEWYSMDQAIEDWPEFEADIRSKFGEWTSPAMYGSGEQLGDSEYARRHFWDAQTQRIRIIQVWYKVLEPVKIAVYSDGEVEYDEDKVDALETAIEVDETLRQSVVVLTRPMQAVRMAHMLDNILLDDRATPYPFHEFPIFPALGYYFWDSPIGMCDLMKDPQREKNKRRTAITEIAGRTAHSGFFNKRDTGADPQEMENYASGAGIVVNYEIDVPKQIEPPEIPQVLVYLENKSDNEIAESVNYNAELMGQRTNSKTVSGKAVEARQQGGLVSQEVFFDSFAEEEAHMTKYMIEMIKDVITPEEALRILGGKVATPEDMQTVIRVLSHAFGTKYDVRITNKPFSATQAMYAVNQFMDMLKTGIPVPPTLLVKSMVDAGMIDAGSGKDWLAVLGPGPVQATQQGGTPAAPPAAPGEAGGAGAAPTQQPGG